MGYRTVKLMAVYNEYAYENNLEQIYHMNEIDDLFAEKSPIDIIGNIDRDFNIHADYFYHNGNVWESLDSWGMEEVVMNNIDRNFIIWILDNWYIEINEVEELDIPICEYDSYNSNLHDLLDNYTGEYETLETLLNNFELSVHEDIYYLEQTII